MIIEVISKAFLLESKKTVSKSKEISEKKVPTGGAKHLDTNYGKSPVNVFPDVSPLQRMHNIGKFFFRDHLK
jgi:hypothetical protein